MRLRYYYEQEEEGKLSFFAACFHLHHGGNKIPLKIDFFPFFLDV